MKAMKTHQGNRRKVKPILRYNLVLRQNDACVQPISVENEMGAKDSASVQLQPIIR